MSAGCPGRTLAQGFPGGRDDAKPARPDQRPFTSRARAGVTLPGVKLLVIGGSGLLGLRVTRQARLAGHSVIATFCASVPPAAEADWRQLDIRRRDDVTALVRRARPDAVINAAYRKPVPRRAGSSTIFERQ